MLNHPRSGVRGAPVEDPLEEAEELPERAPSVKAPSIAQSAAHDIANRRVAAPKVAIFNPDKPEISYKQWRAQINAIVETTQESQLRESIMNSLKGKALNVVMVLGQNASSAEMLKKMEFIYEPVGSYVDMLATITAMRQGSKEDVQSWFVRLETALDDLRNKFPEDINASQLKKQMRDGFRRGLSPDMRNLLRHQMRDPTITVEELYKNCREVEAEEAERKEPPRSREAESTKKKSSAPAMVASVSVGSGKKDKKKRNLMAEVIARQQRVEQALGIEEEPLEVTTQSQQAQSSTPRVAAVQPQQQNQSRDDQSQGDGNNNRGNRNRGRGGRSRGEGSSPSSNGDVANWIQVLAEAINRGPNSGNSQQQEGGNGAGRGRGSDRGSYGGGRGRGYDNQGGRGYNNQTEGFGGPRVGSGMQCHNCGGFGHMWRWCRNGTQAQQLNAQGDQTGSESASPGQQQ